MGGSQSQPSSGRRSFRSSLEDIPKNLYWCLDEVQKWDQQSHQVKDTISQEENTPFDFEDSRRILLQLDEVLPRRQEGRKFFPQQRRASQEKEKMRESAITTTSQTIPAGPSQTPVLPQGPVSRLFALAAKEFVAHQRDMRIHAHAAGTAGMQESKTAEVRPVGFESLESKKKQITQCPAKPIILTCCIVLFCSEYSHPSLYPRLDEPYTPSERISLHLEDLSERNRKDREEILAKYLYLHGFLQRLLRSAEQIYKFKRQDDDYKFHAKPKRIEKFGSLGRHRLQRRLEENEKRLNFALYNFDRARHTLNWLYENYTLQMAFLCINQTIEKAQMERNKAISAESGATLTDLINAFTSRRGDLFPLMEQNEREALSVGLDSLDRNLNGWVSADEVPELSARIFKLLSGSGDRISHASMHSAIDYLQETLTKAQQEINETGAIARNIQTGAGTAAGEEMTVKLETSEERLVHLKAEAQEKKKLLREIYRYLTVSACIHLLGKMESQVAVPQKLGLATLLEELEALQQQSFSDPLFVPIESLEVRRQLLVAALGEDAVAIKQSPESLLKAPPGYGNVGGAATTPAGSMQSTERIEEPSVREPEAFVEERPMKAGQGWDVQEKERSATTHGEKSTMQGAMEKMGISGGTGEPHKGSGLSQRKEAEMFASPQLGTSEAAQKVGTAAGFSGSEMEKSRMPRTIGAEAGTEIARGSGELPAVAEPAQYMQARAEAQQPLESQGQEKPSFWQRTKEAMGLSGEEHSGGGFSKGERSSRPETQEQSQQGQQGEYSQSSRYEKPEESLGQGGQGHGRFRSESEAGYGKEKGRGAEYSQMPQQQFEATTTTTGFSKSPEATMARSEFESPPYGGQQGLSQGPGGFSKASEAEEFRMQQEAQRRPESQTGTPKWLQRNEMHG